MKNVTVSIIVPIHNVERYLEQCVRSLLSQTYHNLEIILVNDGSTDGSAQICRHFSVMDSRIIYIEQENQGVSIARNTGLYCSKGQWISFVDGDDWVAPDMISALLENAENNDVIIGDFFVAKNRKLIETSFFNSNIPKEKKQSTLFLIGNALGCVYYGSVKYCTVGTPWAKLYRREFLMQHKLVFPPNVRRMQDVVFNIGVFLESPQITFCNHPIYYYRIRSESACRRYDPHYDEVLNQSLAALNSCIENTKIPEIQQLYEFKRLWMLLEYISRYYGHFQCTLPIKERRMGIKQLCSVPTNIAALKKYNKEMYAGKQRLVLWLLQHHLYGTVLNLYYFKSLFEKVCLHE